MSELALVKKDTVDVVAQKVREFQERGELHLPANYSPENAMKSAWLILQSTKDRNDKPVLQSCTRDSIANSLLDMVVQGLNPAKKQGYFIAYGSQLVFQRSYFGTMAVAKRVTRCTDIFAEVVYKGDEFEYEVRRGNKRITKHVQKFEHINKDNIIAAYCTIVFGDDREYTEIMTMDQIKQAWKKSQMYKPDGNGTHQQFTEEMAKKTIINRACKNYINSSDDESLIIRHFNRSDETAEEAQIEEEIKQNANGPVIDAEFEVKDEQGPGTETPPPPPPPEQTAKEHPASAGGPGF